MKQAGGEATSNRCNLTPGSRVTVLSFFSFSFFNFQHKELEITDYGLLQLTNSQTINKEIHITLARNRGY